MHENADAPVQQTRAIVAASTVPVPRNAVPNEEVAP